MPERIFDFEPTSKPLIPKAAYFKRQLKFLLYAMVLLTFSLGIGMIGYKLSTGMPWMDAFLNASMILTGMGPIDVMKTSGAKFFAGSYALFSGVIFLSTVAVMFAPLVHRLLHLMHIDEADEK
ncbi:MAG: hypothetical protein SH808_01745 [Saprospiraceae bacterium]|nr:hypothetical protein [Saprospiraceae bacterium]